MYQMMMNDHMMIMRMDMTTTEILALVLKKEEGWRSKPYLCSLGYPTIGYGFKIGPQGANLRDYQFSITPAVGEVWLGEIVNNMVSEIKSYTQIQRALDSVTPERAAIILSMCYQMGVLGVSKFVNTLDMVIKGDYEGAASGMLNSRWAKQTADRAARHAEQMRTGVLNPIYTA